MTVRKQVRNTVDKQFPPEADGKFEPVKSDAIAAWQQKLNDKYGIGQGKMIIIDDPATT